MKNKQILINTGDIKIDEYLENLEYVKKINFDKNTVLNCIKLYEDCKKITIDSTLLNH